MCDDAAIGLAELDRRLQKIAPPLRGEARVWRDIAAKAGMSQPRVRSVLRDLAKRGMVSGPDGKGRGWCRIGTMKFTGVTPSMVHAAAASPQVDSGNVDRNKVYAWLARMAGAEGATLQAIATLRPPAGVEWLCARALDARGEAQDALAVLLMQQQGIKASDTGAESYKKQIVAALSAGRSGNIGGAADAFEFADARDPVFGGARFELLGCGDERTGRGSRACAVASAIAWNSRGCGSSDIENGTPRLRR